MSIQVKYTIELKDSDQPNFDKVEEFEKFKSEFLRDLSWGTHTESLTAAEKTLKNKFGKKHEATWQDLQPTIEPRYISPQSIKENKTISFTVKFSSDQFDFNKEGLNHFIGTIAGDVIKSTRLKSIKIEDVIFPKDIDIFLGPSLGLSGQKKHFEETLGKVNRPLLAFSVKPRIGLSIQEYASIIKDAADGGVDIIEDDERLVDPNYCSFTERVKVIQSLIKKGYKNRFSVNLTANPFPLGKNLTLEERLEMAFQAGIRCVKLDVMVAGFDMLVYLRHLTSKYEKYGEKIAITVFPDVNNIHYRGLSKKFILKLSRLCGADIIYAANPLLGTRIDPISDIEKINHALGEVYEYHELLTHPIDGYQINETLPTMTHDYHPFYVEYITYAMRCLYKNHINYAYFVGGGISGFPSDLSIKEAAELLKKVLEHASTIDLSLINNDFSRISEVETYKINSKLRGDLDAIGWNQNFITNK